MKFIKSISLKSKIIAAEINKKNPKPVKKNIRVFKWRLKGV